MAYYVDVFSPETHAAFSCSDRSVVGHRPRHRKAAERLKKGDLLLCYLTRLSRWVGLLEVAGPVFDDRKPIFVEADDPFTVRMKVDPVVWLPLEQGIPIHEPELWKRLSFTRDHESNSTTWTGTVRTSLARMGDEDGKVIAGLLRKQLKAAKTYALDDAEKRLLRPPTVRRAEGAVVVTVPDDHVEPSETPAAAVVDVRQSIKVQALLAIIGARMGLKIWIPANDRAAVLREAPQAGPAILNTLPLNYDDATLRTIENIDVLWLKGRSMARAFEVEHTTAIYSGILRMADLLALQPNMDIRLHIVAPDARKEKVFDEIRRPVFSLLEGRPLAERCTFLSYDGVREIAALKHLEHLQDSVLEEYAENAQD